MLNSLNIVFYKTYILIQEADVREYVGLQCVKQEGAFNMLTTDAIDLY